MKKTGVQYIKCPRCELNYILKKDKFCDVCKSEMKAGSLRESELEEFEMEEGMEICPICKVNYLSAGETMCATCQEEQGGVIKDDEPDWRGFVESADSSDEELDLLPVEDDIDEELEGAFAQDLDEEFDEEDEEEDSEEFEDEDDFGESDDFDDDDDDEDDDTEEYDDDEDDEY